MLHLERALIGQPQLSAPDWRLVIGWKPRAPDLLQTSGCAPVCPMDEGGGINLQGEARQGEAGQDNGEQVESRSGNPPPLYVGEKEAQNQVLYYIETQHIGAAWQKEGRPYKNTMMFLYAKQM